MTYAVLIYISEYLIADSKDLIWGSVRFPFYRVPQFHAPQKWIYFLMVLARRLIKQQKSKFLLSHKTICHAWCIKLYAVLSYISSQLNYESRYSNPFHIWTQFIMRFFALALLCLHPTFLVYPDIKFWHGSCGWPTNLVELVFRYLTSHHTDDLDFVITAVFSYFPKLYWKSCVF